MTQDLAVTTIQDVRGYLDEKGTAQLNIEDVARGLGLVQAKNGVKYVRYDRINAWLKEWGFPHAVGKDDFIPENMFYRLAMKANNAAAQKFQAKVADEILPSIRKHGMYINPNAPIDPRFLRRIADEIEARDRKIAELQPKADYCDKVLKSPESFPITYIAKAYGMGGVEFNQLLCKLKIQYKVDGRWVLYQKYRDRGYTVQVTKTLKNGLEVTHTHWTHKGRQFIYERLKAEGIVPERERKNPQADLFEEASA